MIHSDFSSALRVIASHMAELVAGRTIHSLTLLPVEALPQYHSTGIGYVQTGEVYGLREGEIISRHTLKSLRIEHPDLGLASSEGMIGRLTARADENLLVFIYEKYPERKELRVVDVTIFAAEETKNFGDYSEIAKWLMEPVHKPD